MGATYDTIPAHLLEWIAKQHIFYVATAPLKPDGHVNVSPKGMDNCFHISNANKVWYEDLTGSGVETLSHIRENGRITVMFSSFEGSPNTVRLFGVGTAHEFGSEEYFSYLPADERRPGSRAVIVVDVYQVTTACGWTTPYYKFERNRVIAEPKFAQLEDKDLASQTRHAEEATTEVEEVLPEDGLRSYWARKNAKSLDGLPGIVSAPHSSGKLNHRKDFPTKLGPSALSRGPASRNEATSWRRKDGVLIGGDLARSAALLATGFGAGILAVLAYHKHVSR